MPDISKQTTSDDEKPLDPVMEKVRRKMVRLLAVSLAVMMTGLMAVLFAVVYKVRGGGKDVAAVRTDIPSNGAIKSGNIVLPAGAYLNGQSLSGDRIALDITLQGGAREIHIIDLASGSVIARYAIKAQ